MYTVLTLHTVHEVNFKDLATVTKSKPVLLDTWGIGLLAFGFG